MNNIPNKLFLQIGTHSADDLAEYAMTHNYEQVFDSDIEFINKSILIRMLTNRNLEITREIASTHGITMSGGQKLHRLRGIKKEIQSLMIQIQRL